MMERNTADGREVSNDGGVTWVLVEPSQAWLDARASEAAQQPTIPGPDPLGDVAAALPAATLEEVNDLLAQVLATLGGN